MNKHSPETEVRCWRVEVKSNIQGIMDRMDGEDSYLLLVNGTPLMEQMEPWLDTYFENDGHDGVDDAFNMETKCILMKKSELMEIEQVDPSYAEQDIDEAIDYQQEMFG